MALRIRDLAANCRPTKTHRWLASLQHQLLRCYTQNVDMLETKAGLATGIGRRFKCIPLHGSLAHLKCHLCHEAYQWDDYRLDIQDHKIEDGDNDRLSLPCFRCTDRCESRKEAGMRLLPIGQLRPSMIMLNQVHPQGEEIAHLARSDGLAHPSVLEEKLGRFWP